MVAVARAVVVAVMWAAAGLARAEAVGLISAEAAGLISAAAARLAPAAAVQWPAQVEAAAFQRAVIPRRSTCRGPAAGRRLRPGRNQAGMSGRAAA